MPYEYPGDSHFLGHPFYMKIIIGAIIGGAIGLGLGYFGKCASGACPLTSNPVIAAILGASIGALLAATK